jgi:uncharacterized protein (DUF2252 family)
LNLDLSKELTFQETGIRKVAEVRGQGFQEKAVQMLRDKERECFELRKEQLELNRVKQENARLRDQVHSLSQEISRLKGVEHQSLTLQE